MTELEFEYVNRAVRSGWISSFGEFIDQFEQEFAEFCGVRHAISVSNGTVAIHLSLVALGIGPGDEVVVPDLSFIATANAVLMSGASPVFADIDPVTLCLDPIDLERRITSKTKAIIPVHLYGHPADMSAIDEVAKRYGLMIIEDAAEAHGAKIGERTVGSFGTCATFSFYGNKNLTTGEGGMITTNDDGLNARCRMLRDHSMSKDKRYWHPEPGFNYRLTNVQSALGCAQLKRAKELLNRRADLLSWYAEELHGVDGIQLNRCANWATPSYWMICAEFEGLNEFRRDKLMYALRARGVDSRPYFYPMSDMPYFSRADTPRAHSIYPRGINLPTYFDLSRRDVSTICGCLRDVWEQ